MAQQKPLDPAIVQKWLSAWNEGDVFSDAAVRHLLSLITDPYCFVIVTLGVGREPRSLLLGRVKRMLRAVPPEPLRPIPGIPRRDTAALWPPRSREMMLRDWREQIDLFRSIPVGPVAPASPAVGQLWHQTGVKSETVPKLERILRWDGDDWAVFRLVYDRYAIAKQGKQVCDFMEALAYAHEHIEATKADCEFIYTYDGSTWGNA